MPLTLFRQGVGPAQVLHILLHNVEEITLPGTVGAGVEHQRSNTHFIQASERLRQRLFFPDHPQCWKVLRHIAESLPLRVRGHDVRLPVGLFAAAKILVEERAGALWIDRRHLVWEGAGATCYVLEDTPNGAVARARPLVLSEEHGEGFLVGQGLVPGDVLITGPLDRVADGTPCVRDEPEGGGGR